MSGPSDDLPVQRVVTQLSDALAARRPVVLAAPPGSGKTTVVPLAMAGAAWLEGRRIIMLEPRRVAARAAASRMATLSGTPLGGLVGFRTRTETRVSPATRIEVVTEGVLTRRLQNDPTLDDVGLIIFDEFHERSLVGDLGLALTLHSRSLVRPDLRVMVMSATLDTAAVAAVLGDAAIITADGHVYPVETRYLPPRDGIDITAAVGSAIRLALRDHPGDVLAFLPGAGEIRRVMDRLDDLSGVAEVVPLHGLLPSADQDRAVRGASDGHRRVVLATAIAETSLTIPGVRIVVDGGLSRRSAFSQRTGMTTLETARVTRATADQRRGRAGRIGPGHCYRLWHEHEQLIPFAPPEIAEADLAPLALDLAAAGIRDPAELRWITDPPPSAYARAMELLRELELVDHAGRLTPHGQRASTFPAHPRIAHMLGAASLMGASELACDLAALLADRDVMRRGNEPADPDIHFRLEALQSLRRGGPVSPEVDRRALERVSQEAARLRRALSGPADGSFGLDAGSLLAMAFPDRVAMARGERGRFAMRGGGEARLDTHHALAGEEFIVAAELDGRRPVSRAWLAAALDRSAIDALFGSQVVVERDVQWSEREERVVTRERRRLGAIVLAERDIAADSATVASVLGRVMIDRGLLDSDAARSHLSRLRFAAGIRPEEFPSSDEPHLVETVDEWLGPFLDGMRRLSDMSRVNVTEALASRLDHRQRRLLEELAPRHFVAPTGSRISIDYDGGAPVASVRIQEMFGIAETPRVGGGRVPVTLHLLSPASRPVQVTSDLAAFWRDSYFDARKELRGRYPRHPWPDDPMSAEPTRRAKPRG